MKRTDYEESLWNSATKRAKGMPIYGGSMRGYAANEVGALGEVVAEDTLKRLGIPVVPQYTTRHDLSALGRTIEVKTKDRTCRPYPDFACSVPDYNHEHQRPDYYVFVSLARAKDSSGGIERFHSAWVVGWCTLEELDTLGVHVAQGDVDESNDWDCSMDCTNILIDQLHPMDMLAAELGA